MNPGAIKIGLAERARRDEAIPHVCTAPGILGGPWSAIQNSEKRKNPSSNGYEAGGGEPNRQVHTLLLNQPKPPTMLPRRNDDDKGSISNTENETQLELLTIFFLTTFFLRKISRENGRNFGSSR